MAFFPSLHFVCLVILSVNIIFSSYFFVNCKYHNPALFLIAIIIYWLYLAVSFYNLPILAVLYLLTFLFKYFHLFLESFSGI